MDSTSFSGYGGRRQFSTERTSLGSTERSPAIQANAYWSPISLSRMYLIIWEAGIDASFLRCLFDAGGWFVFLHQQAIIHLLLIQPLCNQSFHVVGFFVKAVRQWQNVPLDQAVQSIEAEHRHQGCLVTPSNPSRGVIVQIDTRLIVGLRHASFHHAAF